MATIDTPRPNIWLLRASQLGTRLLTLAAGHTSRQIIAVAVAAAVGYLLYASLWLPLTGEVTLPPGVLPTIPAIDQARVEDIIQQQDARTTYPAPNFNVSATVRPNPAITTP